MESSFDPGAFGPALNGLSGSCIRNQRYSTHRIICDLKKIRFRTQNILRLEVQQFRLRTRNILVLRLKVPQSLRRVVGSGDGPE